MMLTIDRTRQMIVDKSTFDEIRGGFALDVDAGVVEIAERTHGGEVHSSRHFPAGIKVIARYPR